MITHDEICILEKWLFELFRDKIKSIDAYRVSNCVQG